jgi:hypothetical protein
MTTWGEIPPRPSTVRDLVVGSGARFADRGVHHLKGVPDPWRLYAVAE